MALTSITGANELYLGGYNRAIATNNLPVLTSPSVLDATGEQLHYVGKLWLPGGPATKTLSDAGGSIFFRTGTPVTIVDAATEIEVGIQAVATGVPARGDGTFLTSFTYGSSDAPAANTFTEAIMDDGTVDLTHGDMIAVVFDMKVRGAADVLNIVHLTPASAFTILPAVTFRTAVPVFSQVFAAPIVMLKFNDGLF